jgi:hypothetical protein
VAVHNSSLPDSTFRECWTGRDNTIKNKSYGYCGIFSSKSIYSLVIRSEINSDLAADDLSGATGPSIINALVKLGPKICELHVLVQQ